MICKDCPHLIKTESVEIAGWWDLYCEKYKISHCPVTNGNLKYLVCVEEEKGEKMISDGMVRGLREYFKEYKGCKNCKHQPEQLEMCDYGKCRQYVELICSRWEKKDG